MTRCRSPKDVWNNAHANALDDGATTDEACEAADRAVARWEDALEMQAEERRERRLMGE